MCCVCCGSFNHISVISSDVNNMYDCAVVDVCNVCTAFLAEQAARRDVKPAFAKKLHILAALEVERHRKRTMDMQTQVMAVTVTVIVTESLQNQYILVKTRKYEQFLL